MPIYGTQFAVGPGPFVPDGDAVLLKPADVGVAGNEPQKLIDDGFKVYLFGGKQRETVRQVKAHLIAEHALRARPRAVFLHDAMFPDMLQEF